MRITRRQLRKIIKEYGGRPYDPTTPGDFERARDNPTGDAPPGGEFDAKLEKMADEIGDRAAGGYEPSMDGSPEAYADHILDVYLQNPPPPLDQIEDLEFVLTKPMYREQIKDAVLEYIGMMTEGRKTRITKRQLRRIIKEEKAKLLKEAPTAEFGIFDQYYLTNLLMEEVESFMDQAGVDSFGPEEINDMRLAVTQALDAVIHQVS